MCELFVDSREPDHVQELAQDLVHDSNDIDVVTVKELETADFAVPELGIGVERKEASDFAASVQDRRISEQGDRMVEEFEHRYVIIEESGDLYNLKYSNIAANSLIGQQVSLAAKRDINLLNTPDAEGTIYAVKRIIERVVGGEAVGHAKTFDVETDRTDVAMLAQVDGVSAEKAEAILEEIDGLWRIGAGINRGDSDITVKKIKRVDGVGDTLAERVIRAFQ